MRKQAPQAVRPLDLLVVDDCYETSNSITASWPDAEVTSPPAERRQFRRVQCAKRAICCPKTSNRVYVLVEDISCSGMAANDWSDLKPDSSVEIILSSGVILPAMVARVTGFGTERVAAFAFDRQLTESELSNFLTPI
jgi:hypothetical protein